MVVLFTLTFLVLLVSCLVSSTVDPADPVMLIYRNGNRQ
jgi:hypothetical protein